MRKLAADNGLDIMIDSAGTHAYHVGEAPDPRSQQAAASRGYNLSDIRTRKVMRDDFNQFDLILALDGGHLRDLKNIQPEGSSAKLSLFCEYAGLGNQDVPDPYYGDVQGFEECLDLVEKATKEIISSFC